MRQKGLVTMENEKITLNDIEAIEEQIIAEEAEIIADEMIAATDQIAQKCREIKNFCEKAANRLAEDWRETNGNPYIRQTHTTKIEIFRNPNDETPVDSFQTTDVKSYSLRALAIAAGITAVLFCASGNIVKKMFTLGE